MHVFFNLRKQKLKLPFIQRDVNEVLNRNAAVPLYKCLSNVSDYHTNKILIYNPHKVKDKVLLGLIPCEMAAWTSFSNSQPLSYILLFIYQGTIMTGFPFGSRVTASGTCLTLAFQTFILEERCVPKCSSIATKLCRAALQEPGATAKKRTL